MIANTVRFLRAFFLLATLTAAVSQLPGQVAMTSGQTYPFGVSGTYQCTGSGLLPTCYLAIGTFTINVPQGATQLDVSVTLDPSSWEVIGVIAKGSTMSHTAGGGYAGSSTMGVATHGESFQYSLSTTSTGNLVLTPGTWVMGLDAYPVSGLQTVSASGTIVATVWYSTPPTISSTSPSAVKAGGQTFTLTVNGTGFVPGSIVQWNGLPLATNYVSVTQLTATVPASLIASPGSATIAVRQTGGPVSWNSVPFPIVAGNGYVISTVAGNGTPGYSGDGGMATSATEFAPGAVGVDSNGNFYIADSGNNVVRKVDVNGIITTVAGTGTNGYSGDGGLATSAMLAQPTGVAVDAAGNIYIADSGSNVVRKVDVNRIITTVAGTGTRGHTGDGGLATKAEIGFPKSVRVDSAGNLFFAEPYNNVVRKVDVNGIISTVAGNGTSGTSGDGSLATSAQLSSPNAVAVDAVGDIYIAVDSCEIRKVDTNGIITRVAGNGTECGWGDDGGPATEAVLNSPQGVDVDAFGDIFLTDASYDRIREVTTDGIITTIAGIGLQGAGYSGDGGLATSALLNGPHGITVGSDGKVYIADTNNNVVRLLTPLLSVPPDLTIAKTHTGNFAQGQTNAIYTVVVSNALSAGPTSGTVTVSEAVPSGLTLIGMKGTGWSCSANTCSRGDAFYGGASYSAITVTVNVASNAPSQVTNQVTVSGGGSVSATANDVTNITGSGGTIPTTTTLVASPSTIAATASTTLTATVTAASGSGTPTGTVTFDLGSTVLNSATLTGTGGPAHATLVVDGSQLAVGSNSITAYYSGDANFASSSASVIVTVTPPPSGPNITAVANGASFQTGFASATWISIFGTALSQTSRGWQGSDFVNGLLPTSLSGVSVTINGVAAYVEYISPTQLNVLAPDDATVGAVQVQVTTAQGNSNSFTAQKQQFAPAFFTMGGSYMAALHADYSYVGKPGLIAGVTTQPAQPGETILIYGTGFGPTNPPLPSGKLVTTAAVLANSVQVTIGGVAAPVVYAGLVGSGLYQFNVTVPNVPNGDAVVVAQIGGVQTQTGILVTVQSPTTPAAPQITSLSPTSGPRGSSVSLVISGTNLSHVTAVQFSPSAGITVSNVNAAASQVTATVTIAASAPTGQVSVSVSVSPSAGISNALAFTILASVPQITSLSPSSGSPGSTVSLSIAGSNLSGVTAVQFSPSTGITVSNVNATATQVTATVTIAASAPTGQVSVSVSSSAGISNALAFTILASVPQITSLSPSSGSPGSTVSLSIAGSNLSGVTAVQFSPSTGITVSNVNATATQVTATVNIAASAPTGQVSVSVSSSAGTSNALVFTILPSPPSYAGQWDGTTSQSQAVSMTVVGSNVTAYSYSVNFPNLGSNCPTGATVTSGPATSIPITGSTFTTSTISGTFQSTTQVSGTINWTLSISGCSASGSVTWSAVKQ